MKTNKKSKENSSVFELSAPEIFVLSSFLGNNTVFGIFEKPFSSKMKNHTKAVSLVKNDLERKKLIRYEIDGTLYIDKNLKTVLNAMSNPDSFLVLCSNLTKGKRQTVYVFLSGDKTITVKKIGRSSIYTIGINSFEMPIEKDETKITAKEGLQYRIPMDEIKKAKGKSNGFSDGGVKKLLNNYCDEIVANQVAKAVCGLNKYLIVKKYIKFLNGYQCTSNNTYIISEKPLKAQIIAENLFVEAASETNGYSNMIALF